MNTASLRAQQGGKQQLGRLHPATRADDLREVEAGKANTLMPDVQLIDAKPEDGQAAGEKPPPVRDFSNFGGGCPEESVRASFRF